VRRVEWKSTCQQAARIEGHSQHCIRAILELITVKSDKSLTFPDGNLDPRNSQSWVALEVVLEVHCNRIALVHRAFAEGDLSNQLFISSTIYWSIDRVTLRCCKLRLRIFPTVIQIVSNRTPAPWNHELLLWSAPKTFSIRGKNSRSEASASLYCDP